MRADMEKAGKIASETYTVDFLRLLRLSHSPTHRECYTDCDNPAAILDF